MDSGIDPLKELLLSSLWKNGWIIELFVNFWI